MPTNKAPMPPSAEQVAIYGQVAARLRAALSERDWSPTLLREKLKMSANNPVVYMWLASKGAPSMRYRPTLSKLLGISVADLTPNDDERGPKGGAAHKAKGKNWGGARTGAGHPQGMVVIEKAPKPVALADVLAFNVSPDGMARLRLDVVLPIDKATPLLRLLLDANLMLTSEPSL